MLTPEQVREIRKKHRNGAIIPQAKIDIEALLADRAKIAQELERIRKNLWHEQTTATALTALIERIKV